VLCFTHNDETIHHWQTYAGNASGVSIVFDREVLLNAITQVKGVSHGDVRYLTINKAKENRFELEEIPFLKRVPYKTDDEFRIVYGTSRKRKKPLQIPLPVNCITRIHLSPWLPKKLSKTVAQNLRTAANDPKLPISRSTLLENEQWKKLSIKK